MNKMCNEIAELVQKGKSRDIQNAVTEALTNGISSQEILDALSYGMNEIGIKFKNEEIFVPEVLMASRAFTKGTEILKPILVKDGINPIGKAVICTVKGDMHDIGKNLVKMMLEGKGIECIDLGTDCEPEKIVQTVKETGAKIVCLSALLTTTMVNQKAVIDALIKADLRDKVTVMVGGAPVSAEYAEEIGADIYTKSGTDAAIEAEKILVI